MAFDLLIFTKDDNVYMIIYLYTQNKGHGLDQDTNTIEELEDLLDICLTYKINVA